MTPVDYSLDTKKVPTLTTKLNQEKKLSIGTRGIGFFWGLLRLNHCQKPIKRQNVV